MIFTSQNHRHATQGIIDDVREEERRRTIGALHDEITDIGTLEALLTVYEIDKFDAPAVGHLEAQGGLATLGEFRGALGFIEMTAGTRVSRWLTRGELRLTTDLNFERRAVARIDPPY